MEKKNKIRSICELILEVMVLAATLVGYWGHWDCSGEYCFISGILISIIFLPAVLILTGHSFGITVLLIIAVFLLFLLFGSVFHFGKRFAGKKK